MTQAQVREARCTSGRVRGAEVAGGVVFRGIPYAAAPVGGRRFRPPGRPEPWGGVRDCGAAGPACPQDLAPTTSGVLHVFDPTGRLDEDCLALDVWTPAPDDAGRPTMVWLHGGGWRGGGGSCPLYDGHAFVRDDVVLVTLNYRLHAFGFLYLDELFPGASGTGLLGILDQLAALEWVRENIAAFGGDPANVTVFGESAGAMSIAALLAMEGGADLCRRAILQSGAGHHAITPAAATRVTRRVLEAVGVDAGDWGALQSAPAASVQRAASLAAAEAGELLAGEWSAAMAFQPVLPELPVATLARGAASGVDLVLGTCADELRFVAWGMPAELQRRRLSPAVAAALEGSGRSVAEVAATYAGEGGDLDRHLAMETDYRYTFPAVCLAERHAARGGRAWLYRFSWPTPVLDGALRACHTLEVPFVFATQTDAPVLVGDDPPPGLADALHGAWVRFARTGDPGWPSYDVTGRPVMDFGVKCRVVDDPQRERRLLWDDLVSVWASPREG
jgi:para-nitrobenzyl esterase